MTGDASTLNFRDEHAERIAASWETTSRRPKRDGLDRIAITGALLAALDGASEESIRLATAAAAHGSAYAATSGTLSALVDEFDDLETVLLDRITERVASNDVHSPADLLATARKLHVNAALARRAATAAFGHTVSTAARKRARIARHDIANAIGTVRNAILLMEDEAGESARDHFRAIAKRNSRSSEILVRSHLADHTALTAALGWDALPLSETGGAQHGGASASSLITNLGALETMLDAIRIAHRQPPGQDDRLAVSFAASGATSGVLTVNVAAKDDMAVDPRALAALRELATALGLRLDDSAHAGAIRLVIPVSARDERHDVGGARQGNHADTVCL
ncbi:MAG: hypothetical protein JWM41_3781 [Gemmatimonadetes bacterium]|nr:hypothetical protein [Gemmatimonadota bacterium]